MEAAVPPNPETRGVSERICRILAGLDTGFAGAIVFIVWLLFHSWLSREYWWSKLNIVAGVFYQNAVFNSGPGMITLTGTAVLLLMYAILGAVFGLYARRKGLIANLFAAIGFVLLWQAFADAFVWKRLNIFALSFLPPSATLPGNLLFGIALIRFPRRFRSIALKLGDASWTSALRRDPAPPAESAAPVEVPFDETMAVERMIDEGSPTQPDAATTDMEAARDTHERPDPATQSGELSVRDETE